MKTLRVRSNIAQLGASAPPGVIVDKFEPSDWGGIYGAWREYQKCQGSDVVLVDGDVGILRRLCLLAYLWPKQFTLVSADVVLSRPKTLRERAGARIWRYLLRSVDRFIVHQRDLGGYSRFFDVTPDRSIYIPFKVNAWDELQRGEITTRDDGYLLCVGRTHRDIPVFIKACALSGVPAMIVRHSAGLARQHGTTIPDGDRPENLKEIVHDGDRASWLRIIANARALVIPIYAETINAAGISTLYDGMALGKPVIIADCPASRGVVTTAQVAIYPPGDAAALAAAMVRVHGDEDYRKGLSSNGLQMIAKLQGESRLHRDMFKVLGATNAPGVGPEAAPELGGSTVEL